MNLNFSGPNAATLTYNVGTVSVSKQIVRFTWRGNNLTGNYLGGATAKCTNGSNVFIFDNLTVTQNVAQVSMRVDWFPALNVQGTCNFNGTYTAQGKLGTVTGNFTCSYTNGAAGNVGTFTVSAIEAGVNGFHGSFSGTDQYCSMTGKFGGVRDVL
jgi:hypothetical protein